jgi:hypothetical protein
MGKIGNYDYPEITFSEAVKLTKQFHDKLKGTATSLSSLAHALDSSEKSGWFKVKVADLKRYGLIEGRGEFKISQIGQDILFYNKKEEYQTAIKIVLNSVALFKDIFQRVGKDVQDINNFRTILVDLTHAEKGEIQNKSEQIRNVYIDIVSGIDEAITLSSENKSQNQGRKKAEDLPNDMISASSGSVYIEMPKDKRYIKIVESLLENLKAQIELEGNEKQ